MPRNPPATHEDVELGTTVLGGVYERLPDCARTEQAKHLLQLSKEAAHQAVESRGRDPEHLMGPTEH